MATVDSTLEIERIKNLIINFGWELIKQEITEDNITLKIRKPIPASDNESDNLPETG